MPIPYNPTRAFQPARVVDVYADLKRSIDEQRRQQRRQRVNQLRTIMEVEEWSDPVDELDVQLRPGYGTHPHTLTHTEL